jgi:membrane protease subunit (stomatin/prohibitin family)
MYGFDKKRLPFFLKGRELLQICLGMNEIIFHFDEDCSVTVLSTEEFFNKNPDLSMEKLRKTVLGRSVSDVYFTNIREISIVFGGSFSIAITDDRMEFESVVFKNGDEFIVV